jgi:ribosomal protein S18 acetylase RimI-like enzyme
MLHHAYYWRERNPGDGPGPAARYVKGWGRPGDTVLIALDDGFPVGAAWYRLFRKGLRGYGFVDDETPELAIAVVPSRRGRGIGEALPDALCERARADGYHALSLSVGRDNPALVSFYEEQGFTQVDGGDEQSLTMRRGL